MVQYRSFLAMRSTSDSRRQTKNIVSLAIFSCFLTLSTSLADEEEQTAEDSGTSDVAFTRLDTVEAIEEYRSERHTIVADGLASSELSHEHMELLANAMSKMYLGIGVSSFTHTEREESSSDEDENTESSARWTVTEEGRIQHAREDISYSLHSSSPFVPMHPLPFDASTGRVLDESISEATFGFDVDMTMNSEAADEYAGIAEKMKWVAEMTVNKIDQSPVSLVMNLSKPVRKRFVFKLTTLKMELHYSHIESCAGYAANRVAVEMKGSVIFAGKLHSVGESTFTDIECQQPIIRLLPEQTESNFRMFGGPG